MTIGELEARFYKEATGLGIAPEHQASLMRLLAPLKERSPGAREHYTHSLRVGLMAAHIATVTFHDASALLLAGTAHDVGKIFIPEDVLTKTQGWSSLDARIMEEHVMAGYEMLKGTFDFSAEIMLWHHKFQKNGYPKVLPPLLHEYSDSTQVLIVEHGRLLALADVFDALHRSNDKFGGRLSSARIRELMFELNPDRRVLISHLYETGVFAS